MPTDPGFGSLPAGHGINAKLAVVAMCANGHSIADPNDAGTLDISGFDADCPALLAEFAIIATPLARLHEAQAV